MTFRKLIETIIDNEVTSKEDLELLKEYGIEAKEDRTYKSIFAIRLIELAKSGDYKAINLIMNLIHESPSESGRIFEDFEKEF